MHSSIDIESWMSVTPAVKVQWQYVSRVADLLKSDECHLLSLEMLQFLTSPLSINRFAECGLYIVSLTNTGAILIYEIILLNLFVSTRTFLRQAKSLKKG
jgi:hypothetical protein